MYYVFVLFIGCYRANLQNILAQRKFLVGKF